MFTCKRSQVEFESPPAEEALVEEAEHARGGRQAQLKVDLQVEPLEVAALEAAEDDLVPAEARQRRRRIPAVPPAAGPPRRGRLAGAAAALAVVERDVVEDVEALVDPALFRVVPPGV